MLQREEGAITVFFSITILVFIIFAAVVVEGCRISIAELQGHRALEVSGEALLAGYNSILKKDYGLYALANPNTDSMKAKLENYFYNNTVEEEEEFWSLYDYSLGDVELLLRNSLNEASVVKLQILQLMKYRGIQAIGETFLDKLQVLASSGKTLDIFEKKLKLERELQQLSQLQQELRQAVEFVRGLDVGLLESNIRHITNATAEILSTGSEIRLTEQEMQRIREALGSTPGSGEELNNALYNCSLKLKQLNNSLIAAKENFKNKNEEAVYAIKVQGENNLNIIELIEKIKLQSSVVGDGLSVYKREYQMNKEQLQQELLEGLDKELDYYQRLIEPEELRVLQIEAQKNVELLGAAKNQLELLISKALDCINSLSYDLLREVAALANSCSSIISGYNNALAYKIPQALALEGESNKELQDNRSSNSEEAKSRLQEAAEGEDVIIAEDILGLLPSRGIEVVNSNKEEIEFEEGKKEEGYTEKGLGEIGNILDSLNNVGLGLRDRLFINEYILGYFKHYTIHQSTNEKGPHNIISRRSLFDYEIEYILYGNPSQLKNISETKRDILLTRFVLNLIYIYTQPQMLNRATVIATALAAPLSAAAMPIIKTMILAGWAMGYSLEELDKLLKGEEIPLVRNKESIKADYRDYLRFFLLSNNTTLDKRLNRVMDIIQLNFNMLSPADTEFVQWGFYTGFDLQSEYSIKYLFMQLPFMQSELGVSGGRYRFKKTIRNSY